jgi:CBS domain containing-hemolysin-like protein
MVSLLLLTVFLLIGSAFCSASEAAVFSSPRIKLETMVKNGDKSAEGLLYLKDHMSRAIGTLVIMNNLFNIVGSILVGVIAHDLFNEYSLAVFSAFFTFLIILFGEVLPKNFGEKNAVSLGIFVAKLVLFFSYIFSPILFVLDKLSFLLFGKGKQHFVSEDEIMFMADLGMKEMSIERDEQELIENVFKMNDKTANDILTPRVKIDALDADLTLNEQKEDIYKISHSRLLVFGEDYDDIRGFVLLREILQALAEGHGDKKPDDFVHPVLSIKENTRVDNLLIMFQKKRTHIAQVVDEFGGTTGLVTLEDVLEELVGEIVDETDEVVDMRDMNQTSFKNAQSA